MSPARDMPDDPKLVNEPTTGKRPARDRHPSRIVDEAAPDEASDAGEPDTTDMDATGDDGQVFGG